MILLSSIIKIFEARFLTQYQTKLLPSHRKALAAMKTCRTKQSPTMLLACTACDQKNQVPHSCGHRNCPHCQNHESQQWLERQLKKQLPAEYFLMTFTLPAQLRALAWYHQRELYAAMIDCCWQTVLKFSHNDKVLQGIPGAIAVLHTHSRRLGYHPHVHLVIPAATIDKHNKCWRTKTSSSKQKKPYLFSHKALAKVFRAKLLEAIKKVGLKLPATYPKTWVVDCKAVGSGTKALIYLGRYLYRGVIQEKNITACENGKVTYRYQNSKTKNWEFRTVTGEQFLWLILQHVLPKGFRRARNFGYLHPNSKHLIALIQLLVKVDPNRALAWIRKRSKMLCQCCGAEMKIVQTQIPVMERWEIQAPT
ncbi:MAG: IS91 family transposase [Gammaproteobacteria bacterium]|nr:MAG: IS91 family transposase [Gammaproteobacteria bacterium]